MTVAGAPHWSWKTEQDRRRLAAIGLSIGMHLLILALFFMRGPIGGLPGGGNLGGGGSAGIGDQEGILISLVRLSGERSSAAVTTARPDTLATMMAEAANAAPQPANSVATLPIKAQSLDALLASADRDLIAKSKAAPAKQVAASARGGSSAAGTNSQAKVASTGKGAGSSAQLGDLWPQVEPCWRRAILTSGTPVVLEFELDDRGRLASAPRVAAQGRSVDAQVLRISVERALQAVAACMPYHAGAGTARRGVYRVSFGLTD